MKRRGRVCVQAGGDEVGLSPVAPRVAAPPWTGKLSGSQVPGAKPPPPLASRAAVRAGEAGEAAARARSPGKRPCAVCSPVLMALARPGRNACSAPDAGATRTGVHGGSRASRGRKGSEERGVLYAPTRCVLNRRGSQQRTPLNPAGSPSLHGLSASSRKGMPRTRSEGNSVNTHRLSLKGAGVMDD